MRASARNVIAIRKHVVAVKGIIFDAFHAPLDAPSPMHSLTILTKMGFRGLSFFSLSLPLFAVGTDLGYLDREKATYYSLRPKISTNGKLWFRYGLVSPRANLPKNRDRAIRGKKLREEFFCSLSES